MMKKIIAAAVLAAAAVVATPMAANAAGYVPTSAVSVAGTVAPGEATTVGIAAGSFMGSETVRVSVTGAGAVTIGAMPTVTTTAEKTANTDGSVSVSVKLPMGATGTYSMTATGASSGNVATTALSVAPAASIGTAADTSAAASSSDPALAFTGSTVPMLLVWSAGGAIVLGGALVLVMANRRRQRESI